MTDELLPLATVLNGTAQTLIANVPSPCSCLRGPTVSFCREPLAVRYGRCRAQRSASRITVISPSADPSFADL